MAIEAARDYSTNCGTAVERLAALLPLTETITVLPKVPIVPQAVLDAIGELEKAVAALPEPTKQDAAREWLTVAQERLEVWRETMRKQKAAKEQAQRARQVSDIYATTSDKVLAGIYAAVEKDFASLYSFVNRDDEDKFKAHLIPSMGKLGFDVDFYGRGFFPPGAYHSEGHQDSMGLCFIPRTNEVPPRRRVHLCGPRRRSHVCGRVSPSRGVYPSEEGVPKHAVHHDHA